MWNTKRKASSEDVQLKQLMAELALKNRTLKKVWLVWGTIGKDDVLLISLTQIEETLSRVQSSAILFYLLLICV